YLGACLIWGFAGLDGAWSKDFGGEVFLWCARAGGVLLALALLVELARKFTERASLEKMFEARKVTRGELREARDFSALFLPAVPSEQQLRDIYKASRGCVWFVDSCRVGAGLRRSERVGFFSIINLTQEAVRLYEVNNLGSFQLNRTHISGPKAK